MAAAALMEPTYDVDKLSYEIFSILESKFFSDYDDGKLSPQVAASPAKQGGKVRILSIDASGDGILAASCLARLESSLRKRSSDPAARIADFFDVAAGSGVGGVLAALLFTRSPDGRPLLSASDALHFLAKNRRSLRPNPKRNGILRGLFRRSGGAFRRAFGDATLRDTVKPMLIPCYDLATGAPFLFSRADAMETDGFDFLMHEVCAATCGGAAAREMASVDGRTKIMAAAGGGGIAMGNPAAAAITHVLNNRGEFPGAAEVEDLLVVSLGGGEATPPGAAELARIAGDGAADVVDQSVAMAFGQNRKSNYVRIQANGFNCETPKPSKSPARDPSKLLEAASEVLSQRNVESVLFRGKKISENTNAEKLEWFAGELIKEHERRKTISVPIVAFKQAMTPRTSSATASTIITRTSTTSSSTSP